MYCATSSPYTLPTHAYVASIPAATPLDDQIFPSVTHLAVGTHVTFGPVVTAQLHERLFVVALRPSRMPERARIVEPVHTETIYLSYALKLIVVLPEMNK